MAQAKTKEVDDTPIRVRAICTGFMGLRRRRQGEKFHLQPYDKKTRIRGKFKKFGMIHVTPQEQYSSRWMEKIDDRGHVIEAAEEENPPNKPETLRERRVREAIEKKEGLHNENEADLA